MRLTAELAAVVALCWLFFFFGLSSFGLLGADEPRYAQVAREMLERRDWITPVLYGKPWLEKPVGYYWAAIASYKVFGVNDWAARFPGALAASAMAGFLYFWMRRFRPGAQLNAVAIMVSAAFMIGFSRGASMDIQVTAPFTAGMLAWWSWHESRRRGWLALFYGCMALGTLAKGPVAPFLAALVIVLYAAARRDLRIVLQSLWVPGIALYLLIAMPWYIAVQLANPQFFREFILQHNLDRFATNRYFHPQPFWYYVPVLLAGLAPWSILSIAAGIRELREVVRKPGSLESNGFGLFLLIWIVAPLLFFSFSHSKLPGYILPCVPPCAVLAALYLQENGRTQSRGPLALVLFHALLPSGLVTAVMLAPSFLLHRHPSAEAIRLAVSTGAVMLAIIAVVVLRGGNRVIRTATLGATAVALVLLVRVCAPLLDATQSMRPLAQQVREAHLGNTPVILFDTPRQVDYGMAYYLNRPLGGPGLQEFSVEHANAFPQCGVYAVIAKPGSQDALQVVAGPGAAIRRVSAAGFVGPWQVYSLARECPTPGSE